MREIGLGLIDGGPVTPREVVRSGRTGQRGMAVVPSSASVFPRASRTKPRLRIAGARQVRLEAAQAVIGILVPDLSNPFVSDCVHVLQNALRGGGYTPLLTFSNGDAKREQLQIDDMRRRGVRGCIFMPAAKSAWRPGPESHGMSLVAIDGLSDHAMVDTVGLQHRTGARQGVEHLIAHGHTRIVAIGSCSDDDSIRQRVVGYKDAMGNAGLVSELEFIDGMESSMILVLSEIMSRENRPTAIFSLHGKASMHILKAVPEVGIRIPQDMALVGFDDLAGAELFASPMTVIRQSSADIGAQAAQLLMQRLAAKRNTSSRYLKAQLEMVFRGSCGCKAATQELSHPRS